MKWIPISEKRMKVYIAHMIQWFIMGALWGASLTYLLIYGIK